MAWGEYNGSTDSPNQTLERVAEYGLLSWPIPAGDRAPAENL